ncbi:MAG: 50S ribosomal protein L2 [Chlamydiae bacterium]|jgi:large subunit ribosomal protein L2|nr:50S ribosomal protein L2 [Chlamydiota bacterium]
MVKSVKPTTPGRRGLIQLEREDLSSKANKPLKSLLSKKNRSSGRNNQGHLTSYHRGGGHKKRYRQIDFKRIKDDIPAKVAAIEYDPNRTSHIALIAYKDGEKSYILAPKGLKEGDMVYSGPNSPLKTGNSLPLMNIPIGLDVHNIELYPGRGGQMVRSAGLAAQIMARSNGYVTLKMPSGEVRMVPEACRATIGILSNAENNLRRIGKAGRSRWMGNRPRVRPVHMNPVDHPMGGGEGRGKGNIPQSRTSVLSKGFKTRTKKKSSRLIVKDRRKK